MNDCRDPWLDWNRREAVTCGGKRGKNSMNEKVKMLLVCSWVEVKKVLLGYATLSYPANLTKQVHLPAPDPPYSPNPTGKLDPASPLTAAEASPVSGLLFD